MKKKKKKNLNEYFRIYLFLLARIGQIVDENAERSRGQRQRSGPRRANGSGKLVRTEIFY